MRRGWIGLWALAFGIASGNAAHGQSFYGREDTADLTLDEKGDGGFAFEFTVFGSPEEGISRYASGEAAKTDEKAYKGRIEEGDVDFRVGNEPASLIVKAPSRSNLSGTYRQIPPKERTERAKRRFDAADKLLNAVYSTVKTEVGKDGLKALRERQREWIHHRDYMAEHSMSGDQDGHNFEFWDTATDLTAARIQFLQLYSGAKVAPGLTGEYTDGYGGHMEVKETKAGIHFSIEVVRGPTSHTGEIDGNARKTKTGFCFQDHPDPGDDREPATLTFTPRDGHILEVKGENTGYYHGARAYFDGAYFKKNPAR